MSLSAIRIVLVETTHPGNIGAAARAMKTMGLTELYLVAPRQYPAAEATARASGADDVLASARVCGSLTEAVAGCTLVVGASARSRTLSWPLVEPRECATRLAMESAHAPVAIVFGREHSGLTNEELAYCNYHVHIPANPAYSSLNLAAAVQILAYEIRLALREPAANDDGKGEPPATAADVERFYGHLEEALVDVGFLDPANPRHLMRRLRRLFSRVRLEATEVNILRGILTAVQGKKGPNGASS